MLILGLNNEVLDLIMERVIFLFFLLYRLLEWHWNSIRNMLKLFLKNVDFWHWRYFRIYIRFGRMRTTSVIDLLQCLIMGLFKYKVLMVSMKQTKTFNTTHSRFCVTFIFNTNNGNLKVCMKFTMYFHRIFITLRIKFKCYIDVVLLSLNTMVRYT